MFSPCYLEKIHISEDKVFKIINNEKYCHYLMYFCNVTHFKKIFQVSALLCYFVSVRQSCSVKRQHRHNNRPAIILAMNAVSLMIEISVLTYSIKVVKHVSSSMSSMCLPTLCWKRLVPWSPEMYLKPLSASKS